MLEAARRGAGGFVGFRWGNGTPGRAVRGQARRGGCARRLRWLAVVSFVVVGSWSQRRNRRETPSPAGWSWVQNGSKWASKSKTVSDGGPFASPVRTRGPFLDGFVNLELVSRYQFERS